MIPEEDTNVKQPNKTILFLGGFLGWFLVNTAIYALLNLPDPQNRMLNSGGGIMVWILVLLGNLIVLTVLATLKKTRMIAFGILSAQALNFYIAISFLNTNEAMCFIPVTYPVYDKPYIRPTPASQTPRPAPTRVAGPIGFHDGNAGQVGKNSCTAFGWTTDPDDRKIDLKVRVLSDGEEVASMTANLQRPDLNVSNGCPGGTCAFEFKLLDLISANESHTILVQAQDTQTGKWFNLNSSPKKLLCIK